MEEKDFEQRVKELEQQLQEKDCKIAGLESDVKNYHDWWISCSRKYDALVESIEATVCLAKGGKQ